MQVTKAVAACLLLMLAGPTRAQTVQCGDTESAVDRIICADDALLEMDRQLSTLAEQKAAESSYLRDAHADWLSGRAACSDRDCLVEYYARRISFLSPVGATVVPDAPDGDLAPEAAFPALGPLDGPEASVAAEETELTFGGAADVGSAASLSEPGDPDGAASAREEDAAASPPLAAPPRSIGDSTAWIALAIGLLVLALLGAAAGLGFIVFYADARDFGRSLAPAGVAVATGFAYAIVGSGEGSSTGVSQWWVLAAGACIVLAMTAHTVTVSMRQNRSILVGALVGVTKVLAASFMVFSLLANLARRQKDDYHRNTVNGRRERAAARTSFVVLGGLWWLLVNGERVRERRQRSADLSAPAHEASEA